MAAPPVKAQYGTPEGVAQAALRADSAHDWRLLLALAHPDALFDYRHSQVMTFKEDGLGFPGVGNFNCLCSNPFFFSIDDTVPDGTAP